MYLAIGIIFLIASLALCGSITVLALMAARTNGNFISKKNLLFIVPAFLLLYLLLVTAAAFNGENLDFLYLFTLVNTVLDTIKFKAPNGLILPICRAYPVFYADFIIALLFGAATVILSILSFFGLRIRNFHKTRKLLREDCDLVLGDSPNAFSYAENTENCILIGTNISRTRYEQLLKSQITVIRAPLFSDVLVKKLKKGVHNLVVFKDGNYSYTKVIEMFTDLKDNGCKITVHLEANQNEMKIIKEKFVSKTTKNINANIYCFSKYELMARKFVEKYPITKYIPRDFYNDNLTLKDGKEINVVFIGFGKVNYQLFRMCAMQFQFAGQQKNKLVSRPVNYYFYDKEEKNLHNEFFSHIAFEIDEAFKDCDFPKPDEICKIHPKRAFINSIDARKEFKSFVGKDSFTYFIISLENDLEDASYAQTLKRILDGQTTYRIFVRAKNNNGETLNSERDSIIYFGEEKQLYSHNAIVNDDITELAQRINLLYSNIKEPKKWLSDLKKASPTEQYAQLTDLLNNAENREYMLKEWSKLEFIKQLSNIYHALNLPFKLGILGFEMKKEIEKTDVEISEEQFDSRYVNSGRKNDYGDYSFYFQTESSNVLAFIEHARWNALYILYDYKQMKKDLMYIQESVKEDGTTKTEVIHQDNDRKLHGCLTTYYGLDELIKFKYKLLNPDSNIKNIDPRSDECLRELGKIYTYDYMDLDRLYGEVYALGYKITTGHSVAITD